MRKTQVFSGFVLVLLTVSQAFAQSDALPQDSSQIMEQASLELPAHPYTSAPAMNDQVICGISHLGQCIADLGKDQVGIFTSPFRLQPKDAFWLAPLGAATGWAFAHDADGAQTVGVDANRTRTANRFADFGSFVATGGEGAGIYLIGLAGHNPKLAETGRLGTEAVIDSGSVTLALKLMSNSQRPRQGNRQRDFWLYGASNWEQDSTFPSEHATATMALARVIAGEYPLWYVAAPAYGFAEAVGVSRMRAIRHSRSDVLVGQAIGFLTGNYLLNHRALYRPGAKRRMVMQMIDSVRPMGDVGNRAFGASIEIPLGR
ncbi:MAG TPA: phosphatase PAP2 family protein [Silvibacterium sp.]|nr:phosphatase PAP2 family protein [Silvibacterium sp.]